MLVGIDEVGRGCWAGPLVAGAVVLNKPIAGLRDSKKLTKLQRQRLAEVIHHEALAVGLGWVDAATIDNVGITTAVKQAMQAALDQITIAYENIIIDGNVNFLADNPRVQTVIQADDSVPAVSAASIIAKVARDAFMTKAAQQYPEYGFEKHVGYGTVLHTERLHTHGLTALHRRSYRPVRAVMDKTA